MGLLDRLTGGKRRANVEATIREMAESARLQPSIQHFHSSQAALWNTFCEGAEDIVWQLVVKNLDKRMDWGLKSKLRKFDEERLLMIYWWMLLYHLILLKHGGVGGRKTPDDFAALEGAATDFVRSHARRTSTGIEAPRPWDERWNHQFTLESAMGIYNGVYEMLGLFNDLTKRVNHVSEFTTATERGFDERLNSLRD